MIKVYVDPEFIHLNKKRVERGLEGRLPVWMVEYGSDSIWYAYHVEFYGWVQTKVSDKPRAAGSTAWILAHDVTVDKLYTRQEIVDMLDEFDS